MVRLLCIQLRAENALRPFLAIFIALVLSCSAANRDLDDESLGTLDGGSYKSIDALIASVLGSEELRKMLPIGLQQEPALRNFLARELVPLEFGLELKSGNVGELLRLFMPSGRSVEQWLDNLTDQGDRTRADIMENMAESRQEHIVTLIPALLNGSTVFGANDAIPNPATWLDKATFVHFSGFDASYIELAFKKQATLDQVLRPLLTLPVVRDWNKLHAHATFIKGTIDSDLLVKYALAANDYATLKHLAEKPARSLQSLRTENHHTPGLSAADISAADSSFHSNKSPFFELDRRPFGIRHGLNNHGSPLYGDRNRMGFEIRISFDDTRKRTPLLTLTELLARWTRTAQFLSAPQEPLSFAPGSTPYTIDQYPITLFSNNVWTPSRCGIKGLTQNTIGNLDRALQQLGSRNTERPEDIKVYMGTMRALLGYPLLPWAKIAERLGKKLDPQQSQKLNAQSSKYLTALEKAIKPAQDYRVDRDEVLAEYLSEWAKTTEIWKIY